MALGVLARGLASLTRAGGRGARVTVRAGARKKFDELEKVPDHIIRQAHKVFVKETPIKSGNARRRTKLKSQKQQIHANYPYAQRLDTGWSRQAPDGMSKPTRDALGKYAKKLAIKIDRI
jgi:hypothetical protein